MKLFNIFKRIYEEFQASPNGEMIISENSKGFYEGKEFRTFFEFDGLISSVKVVKVAIPCNFTMKMQNITLNDGELTFEILSGGTEGGSFSNTLPVIGVNRSTNRNLPYYEAKGVLTSGGSHTGGTLLELAKLKTSNATAQKSTVGGSVGDSRCLAAGTYYIRFTAVAATKGIYTLRWEEE